VVFHLFHYVGIEDINWVHSGCCGNGRRMCCVGCGTVAVGVLPVCKIMLYDWNSVFAQRIGHRGLRPASSSSTLLLLLLLLILLLLETNEIYCSINNYMGNHCLRVETQRKSLCPSRLNLLFVCL